MGDKHFKARSFEWFVRKVELLDNGLNPNTWIPRMLLWRCVTKCGELGVLIAMAINIKNDVQNWRSLLLWRSYGPRYIKKRSLLIVRLTWHLPKELWHNGKGTKSTRKKF